MCKPAKETQDLVLHFEVMNQSFRKKLKLKSKLISKILNRREK